MKNFINYYYGFYINNIYFSNNKYFFQIGNEKYMLQTCENPTIISYCNEINYQLNQYYYFFSFVLNKENNYITLIENKPYLLLKLNNMINSKISIFDIKNDYFIDVHGKISNLNRFPWTRLWENKIDYFERILFSKKESYKKIYPIFHYFIGIAENALLYLKQTIQEEEQEDSDRVVISHSRITIDYELYDYYNPVNIIIDHSSRDISEYIKSMFLHRVWDLDILSQYLDRNYFSRYGIRMIFARILFPSFFFDDLENMILHSSDINVLLLESRAEEFENFIREIGTFFMNKYDIPMLSWIIKET